MSIYRESRKALKLTQSGLSKRLKINLRTIKGREAGEGRYPLKEENLLALQALTFAGPFRVKLESSRGSWHEYAECEGPFESLAVAVKEAIALSSKYDERRWHITGSFGQIVLEFPQDD